MHEQIRTLIEPAKKSKSALKKKVTASSSKSKESRAKKIAKKTEKKPIRKIARRK